MWKCGTLVALAISVGGNIIAGDNLLEKPVEVRIGQSGFAGVTGTAYTVDVLGNWDAVEFWNDQDVSESRSGVLTREQTQELSELLESDLSSGSMDNVEVNPMTIEVRYGDTVSTLTLPPDTELVGNGPESEEKDGLRPLASWFKSTIDGEKP